MGFKFLKMDVGIGLLEGIEDALVAPPGMLATQENLHPFTGIQITDKGIDLLCQYVADVRDEMGYEVPLAVDHFGHIGVESCIRLGKALDQFSLRGTRIWYPCSFPSSGSAWPKLSIRQSARARISISTRIMSR